MVKALKRKLDCEKREESHHTYFDFFHEDMLVASTYVSRGAGGNDLDDYLLGEMAGQIGVSKYTFVEMVRCTKDKNHVLTELKERGAL